MTTQPDSPTLLPVLALLNEALGRLTSALVTGEPDAVLAAEESLGAAVRQAAARRPKAGEDLRQLLETIRAIRIAVLTCERLGRTSAALMQAMSSGPYAANGQLAPAIVPATVVSRN